IDRHGEEPEVIRCRTRRDELDAIVEMARAFVNSQHNTLGIICKTQKQASQVHEALVGGKFERLQLLSEQSVAFGQGIIVCTAHMAKGLEFDQVIVPGATANQYANEMERNLLYIACTRAMHRLALTHTGEITPFLEAA
ncbi:3'-5' exonuclease, partial [Halomonas sp. BC04]|uniref:3'-5' exonuclease n=1 Tax=Halomonas sp. BC04 TaxID=1403540 RepID=UPI0003ED640C